MLRVTSIAAILVMTSLSGSAPGYAWSWLWGVPSSGTPRHFETWAGADVGQNVWLTYSGTTVSPFVDMHAPGLKLRIAGGYGGYKYTCSNPDPGGASRTCRGKTTYTEALAGYLFRYQDLTVKGFGGISAIGHDIKPFDSETVAVGQQYGVEAVAELWLNLGTSGFASLDLAWSEAHNTRSGRARIGYQVMPQLYLGLEGAANLDAQGSCKLDPTSRTDCKTSGTAGPAQSELLDFSRGGAFARFAWDGGEASVSAGVLGTNLDVASGHEIEPYVTVNWLTQF